MSAREVAQWIAFERVNGPILLHERIDAAAAHICSVFASVMSGNEVSAERFLPAWDSDEHVEHPEQSDDDMIALMRGVQKKQA